MSLMVGMKAVNVINWKVVGKETDGPGADVFVFVGEQCFRFCGTHCVEGPEGAELGDGVF